MNKKIIYGIIVAIIFIIGLSSLLLKYPLNISGDPFGTPPKGTSPNCGPENRYKFDVTINSKEDFVNFLKNSEGKLLDQYGNNWVDLDNFKNINQGMSYEDIKSAEVDWNKVLSEVKTGNVGFKTIYILKYNPFTCSGFTLKMTSDGHVSVYGCCGI